MSVLLIKADSMAEDGVEVLRICPLTMRILEDGRNTDNRLSTVEIIIPPHTEGPPLHFHVMHDETFFTTKGSIRFRTDEGSIDTYPGDYIIVPIKAMHTFANFGKEEARCINTCTPAFYVDYFRTLASKSAAGIALPPDEVFKEMAMYATLPAEEKKNLVGEGGLAGDN